MELTPSVAASGVFVALCFGMYMYPAYRIFNEYEKDVLQCKNIDLETLARSVDARYVNSPQVSRFFQVYHYSGGQGSTKVIIFDAILFC